MNGRLVPRRDVRGRGRVELVEAAQQPTVERRELVLLVGRESGEVGHVPVREHVDLDGPARREGHEGREVLALQQHARPALLSLEQSREEVVALGVDRTQQCARARGHEGVGVDLAVRVGESHPDLLPAVLEGEDLLHSGHPAQSLGALRPRFDDRAGATDAERPEGSLVLG